MGRRLYVRERAPAEREAAVQREYELARAENATIAGYALCAYSVAVKVAFDPKKNAANFKKHGISLAEGDGVLNDPLAMTIEDDSAEGEQRFVSVGMNSFGSLMVVAYAYRGEDVRLISVRKAEPKERRAYEKGV